MSAFEQARSVEARAVGCLLPFIKERAHDGQFVLPNKGPLARHLQETAGDVLLNIGPDELWSVEIKAEAERRSDNFFLEVWSNRNLEDQGSHISRGSNPGWMYKLNSRLLFYYFLDVDELYIINFFNLKRWAFGAGGIQPRIWGFQQKRQNKYDQLNDTWGAIVPIAVVGKEVGFKLVSPRQTQLFNEENANLFSPQPHRMEQREKSNTDNSPEYNETADAARSYDAAISAIGERVAAGEPLPTGGYFGGEE